MPTGTRPGVQVLKSISFSSGTWVTNVQVPQFQNIVSLCYVPAHVFQGLVLMKWSKFQIKLQGNGNIWERPYGIG
jgi:hypothetical protein